MQHHSAWQAPPQLTPTTYGLSLTFDPISSSRQATPGSSSLLGSETVLGSLGQHAFAYGISGSSHTSCWEGSNASVTTMAPQLGAAVQQLLAMLASGQCTPESLSQQAATQQLGQQQVFATALAPSSAPADGNVLHQLHQLQESLCALGLLSSQQTGFDSELRHPGFSSASLASAGFHTNHTMGGPEECVGVEPSLGHLPLELQARLRKPIKIIQPISRSWEAEALQHNSMPCTAAVMAAGPAMWLSAPSASDPYSPTSSGGHTTTAMLGAASSASPQAVATTAANPLPSSTSRGFKPVGPASHLRPSVLACSRSMGSSPQHAGTSAPLCNDAGVRIDGDQLVQQLASARQASTAVTDPSAYSASTVLMSLQHLAPPPACSSLPSRAPSLSGQLPTWAPTQLPRTLSNPLSRTLSSSLARTVSSTPSVQAPMLPLPLMATPSQPTSSSQPGITTCNPLARTDPLKMPPAKRARTAACHAAMAEPPLPPVPSPAAAAAVVATPALAITASRAGEQQQPSLHAVQGQLSTLYQWYQSNKSMYLEHAKQSLARLEAQHAAAAAATDAGLPQTQPALTVTHEAAVARAFERAVQIIHASSNIEAKSVARIATSATNTIPCAASQAAVVANDIIQAARCAMEAATASHVPLAEYVGGGSDGSEAVVLASLRHGPVPVQCVGALSS